MFVTYFNSGGQAETLFLREAVKHFKKSGGGGRDEFWSGKGHGIL